MSRLIRYLRGSVRFRLTGAAPEQCLNALAAARLEFWDIEREDALNLSLCVPAREAERLQGLALRCLCTAEVTERSGLRAQFGGLLRRPVLLLGLLAAARPAAGAAGGGRGNVRAAGIRLDDRGRGK